VQTEWRVACVRIPRFPIGAVFRARTEAGSGKGDAQLLLSLEEKKREGCCSTAEEQFPAAPEQQFSAAASRRVKFSGPASRVPSLRAGEADELVGSTAPKARRELNRAEGAAENCSHWDNQLLALTDGAANRPRLRSVSAAAARAGVRAGMTLAEARALCAKLEALPWDDVVISAAITETTAMLVQASPQVSPVPGAPGMWWVGASGFAEGVRAGGGGNDPALAAELLTIARYWHPRARVAIADTCIAARAATWAGASFGADRDPTSTRGLVAVIPRGGDAAYLASAPLTLLPMDPEMRDALRALGVRTIGQFGDLDPGDVEQRWGDDGLIAWRLAHGDDPRRPVLARLIEQPHVEMELATPAATMEPVLFLVRPALETLVTQLVSRGRTIASLAITLTLDDARGALPAAPAHTVTREIRLPRPLARTAPLFERCRGLLARWPLTAPVTAVRLTVLLTGTLTGHQGNLLNTSWRDPGAADAALERVRAELGPDVVVKPHARDGYALERNGQWREEFSAAPSARFSSRTHASRGYPAFGAVEPARLMASPARSEGTREAGPENLTRREAAAANCSAENILRLLEKPERVDVDRDTAPRRILWRGRAIAVTHAAGPERLSGDWWNDGYSRDYWRCESDDETGELVLYRDPTGWWVQGWYD
jgi:protein ImuB